MNNLMIIEVQKKRDTSSKEQLRENQQKKIVDFSEWEDYIFENIIDSEPYSVNDFEDDDLTDIVNSLIQSDGKVTSDRMAALINEHNIETINAATYSFAQNIGVDNWVELVEDQCGEIESKDDEDRVDAAFLILFREASEMIFRGMHASFFTKIISFCGKNNIELHLSEKDEISDVLYFANVLDMKDRYRKILMPSIHKAILFSPLNGVSGNQAFIMNDTLYVSRELMVGGASLA